MLLIEKAIDTVYIRNMVSLYDLAHWAFNKRCFEIVESQLTMAARADIDTAWLLLLIFLS